MQVENSESSWSATMVIPYSLVGKSSAYRMGFFRVQMDDTWTKDGLTTASTCSTTNCTFACANCPTTPEPDYHYSAFMGLVTIAP